MVTIVASSTTISCATPSRDRTAHRFGSGWVEATDISWATFRRTPWLLRSYSPRCASWRRCQAIESRNSLVRDPSVVLGNDWDRDERNALTGPVAGPTTTRSGTRARGARPATAGGARRG